MLYGDEGDISVGFRYIYMPCAIKIFFCGAGLATTLLLQGCGNNENEPAPSSALNQSSSGKGSLSGPPLHKATLIPAQEWLTALCSSDESARFGAIKEATSSISSLSVAQLEGALSSIATGGNASTLLFVATQTKTPIFYSLSSDQLDALKDLPGAFPNLPAYFGAVLPDKGYLELKKLYLARPDMSLPILRAMGTTQRLEAKHWLIQEAIRQKKLGGDAYATMAGLSRFVGEVVLTGEELGQLLDMGLNREELILLSKAPVVLNKDELGVLLSKGGPAAAFGQEQLLRDPLANADLLSASISKLLDLGKLKEASVLLNSDKVRSINDTVILERLNQLHMRLSNLENSLKK